jgi:aminoglycoside phosphotransferase (APT) family kinase protein
VDARIGAERLGQWLDRHDAPGHGELPEVETLGGGSQNVLLRVKRGGERMVLRMPGDRADQKRLNELLREIRLVRALKGTDVPHAELIAADETGELMGKPFY